MEGCSLITNCSGWHYQVPADQRTIQDACAPECDKLPAAARDDLFRETHGKRGRNPGAKQRQALRFPFDLVDGLFPRQGSKRFEFLGWILGDDFLDDAVVFNITGKSYRLRKNNDKTKSSKN